MTALVVASTGPSITHISPSLSHDFPRRQRLPVSSFQKPDLVHLSQSAAPNHSSPNTKQRKSYDNFPTLLDGSLTSDGYVCLIESCKVLDLGGQIHAHVLKTGFGGHEFLETKLLRMYGRCGSFEKASLLFDKMLFRNIYSWTGILTVCADHGCFEEAILLFQQMLVEGIEFEFFVFPIVLKACSGLNALNLGRQLHGFVIKGQFVGNIYVGNALIDMYGKCGCLDGARMVLEKLPEKDCVSWNSMVTACVTNGMVFEALDLLENMKLSGNLMPNLISWSAAIGGFAQNGCDKEALELLHQMQANGVKPNARTLASALPACARLQTLSIGKEIHGYIMRHEYMSNSFVVNGLVDVYRRCADMGNALKIFSKFSMRNLVSFNTMIVGYCENGELSRAKEMFDQMELVGVKKDTISWNSMISGYVDNGKSDEALKMFKDMCIEEGIEPDSFTLGSVITACADRAALGQGKEMHSFAVSRGLHSNTFVGGALVEMYCRVGELVAAQMIFDQIVEKDTATWNSLISGYARHSQMEHVYNLIYKMKSEGLDPNIYTWNGVLTGYVENGNNELALQRFTDTQITSNLKPDIYSIGIVLHACSRLATIERGKQVHAYSIRCWYDSDVHIGATLIDMYAKCGSISYGWRAYYRIPSHNLISQNSMLAGYAMHGLEKEGIALFHQMLADGIRPDKITFLSVLSLCAHAGSVDEGKKYFALMANYDIKPMLKHYTCMVDLFSRAGRLTEAYNLIERLPAEPDAVIWSSLLSGCVIHGNVELGERAANRLIELEPKNTGNYILLGNLYASAGRWSDLARTRQNIKNSRMLKSPGCSWIEDRDQLHIFLASDRSHEQTDDIYTTLESLTLHMRKEGYTVQTYPIHSNYQELTETQGFPI